jgi:HTH-type transcriptional regulator / antitoxin HigA
MEIHALKTTEDYENTLAQIDQLWGSPVGSADGDKLDVLLILIEAFEAKHYPIAPPNPIDALRFRMEQMDLKRADLEPMIGSRARVAEILNGKRNLTLTMIRKLHAQLKIPLESLVLRGA